MLSGNPSIGLRDVSAGLHSMAHGARVINDAANASYWQSIGGSRGDSIVENKKQQDAKLLEEARRQEEAKKAKNLPDNNQDVYWNK